MNTDHIVYSNKKGLRCTGCGTTNTPLWRLGPEGPKSMCNACGIKWKRKVSGKKKKKNQHSSRETVEVKIASIQDLDTDSLPISDSDENLLENLDSSPVREGQGSGSEENTSEGNEDNTLTSAQLNAIMDYFNLFSQDSKGEKRKLQDQSRFKKPKLGQPVVDPSPEEWLEQYVHPTFNFYHRRQKPLRGHHTAILELRRSNVQLGKFMQAAEFELQRFEAEYDESPQLGPESALHTLIHIGRSVKI
jgi:hypothetical protein